MTSPSRPATRALLAIVMLVLAVPGVGAQTVRPWLPAGTDSLIVWTTLAKTRFQQVRGDSAGGTNLEGYQRVADAARRLLQQLGRKNLAQSPAIETVLDSLGLDTDLLYDATVPNVVFLMVRNPYRPAADAVGYLLWFMQNDIRSQGVVYPPNRDSRFRAWFTGIREAPYEAAVIFQIRRAPYSLAMHLYRVVPNGFAWSLIQYERAGPDFGPPGDARFVDVNNDGHPEIASWTKVDPDTFVSFASGVPSLLNEGLWVERPEGFVLQDVRLVPSPLATLTAFLRHLLARQSDAAARLLLDPARVSEAVSLGWSTHHARGTWTVEYGEPEQAWPEWYEVRHRTAREDRRYIIHFAWRDGRWLIRDWTPVRPAPSPDRPLTPHPAAPRVR